MRSQTALTSVNVSSRPTMMGGRPDKTKHVSRERSPPLMQQHQSTKGKKSPHQKKDRRASNKASAAYQTGKSSAASIKNSTRGVVLKNSPNAETRQFSKTSLGNAD